MCFHPARGDQPLRHGAYAKHHWRWALGGSTSGSWLAQDPLGDNARSGRGGRVSEQLRYVVLFGVAAATAACGDDGTGTRPIDPVSPPPPPGLDTGGAPLFELDTTTPEHVAVVEGAPSGF